MTPFEISILLHYAITDEMFPIPSAQLSITLTEFFQAGYLGQDPTAFSTNTLTEKGEFYVRALQAVPEPKTVYIIEEQPEKEFHEGDVTR